MQDQHYEESQRLFLHIAEEYKSRNMIKKNQLMSSGNCYPEYSKS